MKKTLALALALITLVTCTCFASAEQVRVTTSFYPIHILAMNVFSGIDGIALECMTVPQTGCLHDYQLMVNDMMKLSDSNALIVCGAGMEGYLADVMQQFDQLLIIDCSEGISLLCDEKHDHDHEHAHEEAYNAHTWLDVQNAIQIVNTIAAHSSALFPEYAEQILRNAANYTQRLEDLDTEIRKMLAPVQGKNIVTFHEAFPYFANAYGLQIAAVITQNHEDTLSPTQLIEAIDAVRSSGNPPLFTEPQYADNAARAIAAETGAKVYELDPLVSGEITPDAYENGMLKNAQVLLDALK